jgi:hypothetical protein
VFVRLSIIWASAVVALAYMVSQGEAQGRPPSAFCPALSAISHNPNKDLTGTPRDTFIRVNAVKERYQHAIFHRCPGIVSVGIGALTPGPGPKDDWLIGIDVLTRDMPLRRPPLILEGVRLKLTPVCCRPSLLPDRRHHRQNGHS